MMLIDSHCHLDIKGLDEELDEVMARAEAAGVGAMVTICTRVEDFPRVLEIAKRRDNIWCSVGLHPHDAAREPELETEHLIRLSAHPKVVGIGESGLDFHYERSPPEVQVAQFRKHIRAARETGLPLIVHSRAADEEMAAILREEREEGPFSGVMHCFSSGPSLAEAALGVGLYLSFSGILTFKNAEELRDIAKSVPRERILVETDSPFLAPVPMRGKRCEPAFLAHTADALGRLLAIGADEVARLTTANFHSLFTKARPLAAA